MEGVLLLAGYLFAGLVLCEGAFARRARAVRVWMGLTAGLVMMMWLPCLWAFALDFTRAAAILGLALALLLAGAGFWWGKGRRFRPEKSSMPPVCAVLALVVPFTLLFALLQYTHYFREAGGALYVGQSTYGDICMHSAIITSLQNASFPPEYSILPGSRLGYPFLMDALSACMVLFGTPLSLSMTIPGTIMGALVFWGFLLLAWKLTGCMRASAVAFLLLFLNGGLGFAYVFDLAAEDSSALTAVFTQYYQAPANMPDLNLRWVNILCDMLLPQRTFLAGFVVLIPALWLLADALQRREKGERDGLVWIKLGVLGGAMPMIHTHSFLALGLITAGAMLVLIVRERGWKRMDGFVAYGAIAVLMALPQLCIWTFPQTDTSGALALWPGWVNNTGAGLRDETLWFWVKNVGPVFLLLVPAACSARARERALCVGAALAFVVANLVRFQTLLYDNNKIMYAAYMLVCPVAGAYLVALYDKLRGMAGRRWIALCFLFVSLASGALSVGREIVSDYQIFSSSETRAADFLREQTQEHCTVLTGRQHNNLASVLAGKNVVCGPDNFLYTHGLDYSDRAQAVVQMYENPQESQALFARYEVDYVLLSSQERGQFAVDGDWFARNATLVYESGDVCIYALN